ncbi:MAG: DivIVA domain-containing protein [Clostridia bacterium]|nr:DivIVA domain-containing protein [Clostridia bacterium]
MISPNELKNKTFQPAFRGYDRAEVEGYLALVAEQLAQLQSNYEAMRVRLSSTEAELAEMKKNEDAIRRALVNSQNAAAQVVDEAKQKGEELEKLTREKCGKVIEEFRENIRAERERLNMLRAQTANFKTRIYELYQSHIEMVEGITKTLEEGDWDMSPTDATRTVLALLRGEYDRRTRIDEIEEKKIDHEIDIVIDRLSKITPPADTPQ